MALEIDTSRAFLSLAARRTLIDAVRHAAPNESEPDWIEWKGPVDLTAKRWMAEIARHVIGFANRDPERAARVADGFGYLLLGVEPGNLWGVERIDTAQLESGTSAYLGLDGPQASSEYIDIEDMSVLVVTVQPPRAGDRIYHFEKEYQHADVGDDGLRIHYRNGDIFVRREGRTERARAGDLRMLERRLIGGVTPEVTLDIDLGWWDEAKPLTPVRVDEDEIEQWAKSERARLRRAPDPPATSAIDALRFARAQSALGFEMEERTPDEYERQVDAYIDKGSAELPGLIRAVAVQDRLGLVKLAALNNTEHNYEAVVVELYLPGSVRAYFEEEDAWADAELFPKRPRPWGPKRRSFRPLIAIPPSLPSGPLLRRGRIDNSESARITFEPVHLRPGHRVSLREVHLVVTAPPAEGELVGSWTATSTSVSGIAEGAFTFGLDETIGAFDLLERPREPDDD